MVGRSTLCIWFHWALQPEQGDTQLVYEGVMRWERTLEPVGSSGCRRAVCRWSRPEIAVVLFRKNELNFCNLRRRAMCPGQMREFGGLVVARSVLAAYTLGHVAAKFAVVRVQIHHM